LSNGSWTTLSRGGCTHGAILAVFIAVIACPARHPQEAMKCSAPIIVVSRDRAHRVDTLGLATQACAGSVERRDGAVASAQETVNGTARVKVVSRDCTRRVDTLGDGTQACAGSVERGDDAVARAVTPEPALEIVWLRENSLSVFHPRRSRLPSTLPCKNHRMQRGGRLSHISAP
jgi:hypothetical protein